MAVVITYDQWIPGDPPITSTNGIINPGDSLVSQNAGMNIQVSTGSAWIRGTFSHTGDPQILTVSNNISGVTRYDLVVIHIDFLADTATYLIKTGNLNPVQNNLIWELPLAIITVANGAVSIVNANIGDLRVVSNDYTLKTICTLTRGSNLTVSGGVERTINWDTPTVANDTYRFFGFQNYIQARVRAWYNVQTQIRWDAPGGTNAEPVIFKVNMVDPITFQQTEIYNISSAELTPGAVNFTFNQNMLIPQSHYIYMSLQNTSNVNVRALSVATISPIFRLQFMTYPIDLI